MQPLRSSRHTQGGDLDDETHELTDRIGSHHLKGREVQLDWPTTVTELHDGRDDGASGFVCPQFGGALWARNHGDSLRLECRIGDAFSAAELWIEHSAARNRTLKGAVRTLAENAALARKLAAWARERGNHAAAERLEEEALEGEQLRGLVSRVLEGLPLPVQDDVANLRNL